MIHICQDELGYIAIAIGTITALARPVYNCAKCQAIYIYKRLRRID